MSKLDVTVWGIAPRREQTLDREVVPGVSGSGSSINIEKGAFASVEISDEWSSENHGSRLYVPRHALIVLRSDSSSLIAAGRFVVYIIRGARPESLIIVLKSHDIRQLLIVVFQTPIHSEVWRIHSYPSQVVAILKLIKFEVFEEVA